MHAFQLYTATCVMLRFSSWMKVASLHHDYMCLVTVHSRNFAVWWCRWIPCGLSRGVEIVWGKSVDGKVILTGRCQWGGFPTASSSSLVGKNSEEKSLQLDASLSCVTSMLSLHGGKMQSCSRVWPLFGCLGIKASERPKVTSWPLFCWPSHVTIRSSYE